MLINIHKTYRNVVSICDAELLGKKFEQGNSQLDVKESFFNGEKASPEEAKQILQKMANEDATFNIIGKKSIKTAIDAGIITKENIKEIQKIPYALVLV